MRSKLDVLFPVLMGLTAAAVVTNFISFVSPNWIQSVPNAHSQFQRIGLWTACFNGYMRPDDFNKAYFGCYYIYFIEYDRIRSWINPIWLYSIQTLSSCGMLFHALVEFVMLCQLTKSVDRNDIKVAKFYIVGHFFTCVTLVASLVAFAIARYDSTWMPYPQTNVLSWSYAVAVLSFVLTLSSFIVAFIRYMYLDATLKSYEEGLLNDQEEPAQFSPPYKEPPLSDAEEHPTSFFSSARDLEPANSFVPREGNNYPVQPHGFSRNGFDRN